VAQGLPRLGRPLIEHVRGHGRLHVDEGELVADDVVQVTGDAQALVGDAPTRLPLSALFGAPDPLLDLGEVFAPVPCGVPRGHRQATEGRQREVLHPDG